MKKFSFVLAVFALACLLALSAFATDAVAEISDATAKAGEEVTVSVVIKNSPGIAGAQFYVEYNTDVFTYVSATGSSKSFYFASSEDEGANPVKLVIANLSLTNITGDIAVADVVFKVNSSAKAGKYDLTISESEVYDGNIQPVAVSVDNAVITVKGTGSGNNGQVSTDPAPKFEKQRDYTDSFVDVTGDKWFYKYVKLAYEYKLANGTSATKFSPDNKFTVAQALTAAVNIHTTYNGTTVRAAAAGEAWYTPYVEYCVEKGIVKEGQFANFDANITRGDMAVVFANVLPEKEYTAVRDGAPADVVEESAVYLSVKNCIRRVS